VSRPRLGSGCSRIRSRNVDHLNAMSDDEINEVKYFYESDIFLPKIYLLVHADFLSLVPCSSSHNI
jgi:hypothetical protein